MSHVIFEIDQQAGQKFRDELLTHDSEIEVVAGSAATVPYLHDRTADPTRSDHPEQGPTVVFPTSASQVQTIVVAAAKHGLSVVPRGAGTGLSGGASATESQVVLSTEKLNQIIEISAADGVAVVEPGVLNGDLNRVLEPLGLFYAPDPASAAISSIGGNVATNAGGMRCAKYGVTRQSVLSLQVVLADGSLISIGHRSLKGVTGLDLVSLFVGSEGTLGIVVQATVRILPIPVARRTLSLFFDQTLDAARAVELIKTSTVQPAVLELIDGPSLAAIDEHSGSSLRQNGAGLLLVELDGYGIDEQVRDLRKIVLHLGGRLNEVSDEEGQELWELRRSGRGFPTHKWHIGEDIAVPSSKLADIFEFFPEIERQFGVSVSAVAHAGDGNLHPLLTQNRDEADISNQAPPSLAQAANALIKKTLELGGTITGEHGVGNVKLHWSEWELAERVRSLQFDLKHVLDPSSLFNPGKAL